MASPEFKLTEPPKQSLPTITVTLDSRFHTYVLQAAQDDDRTPSKWLKRFTQENLEGLLKK